MPYLFVRDYEIELMEMNKDLYHVYVESHGGSGGERKLVRLRMNERGLPSHCATTTASWVRWRRPQRSGTSPPLRLNYRR